MDKKSFELVDKLWNKINEMSTDLSSKQCLYSSTLKALRELKGGIDGLFGNYLIENSNTVQEYIGAGLYNVVNVSDLDIDNNDITNYIKEMFTGRNILVSINGVDSDSENYDEAEYYLLSNNIRFSIQDFEFSGSDNGDLCWEDESLVVQI